MWAIVWKEKSHAWVKMLLDIGKICINVMAWTLAYAIYKKSEVFVKEAKELMNKPEYMENDMLGTEKIQLVYISGVVITAVIAIGIAILFWCIVRAEMKKRRSKMALLMALGYNIVNIRKFYMYHIVVDTVASIAISIVLALGAWQLFLTFSPEYVEQLNFVGLNQRMDIAGVIYATILALLMQWFALELSFRKLKKTCIREMITEK